ncbi:60S ribosomal protein L27 [Phytophthora citrophthora]|uniref:60S ribosomal protein L27 n=1 Tax=Phytophthora citrophthora TaxID=4793 RepID=A0AAD9LVJ5_9STRA|nr:60S ribosomal protein L27 [Phytophthora citrophthora]
MGMPASRFKVPGYRKGRLDDGQTDQMRIKTTSGAEATGTTTGNNKEKRLTHIVKNGKVVVLLNGRFAGRKAIVVKTYDEGHADRKFGHAIVAGIDRYPRKVTRSMGKNKLKKRSKVKPFVKYVNYNHIMPTRYVADIDLKKVLDDEVLANPETRVESRKTIKKVFEERYLNQAACKSEKKAAGVSFFFKKLRF